MDYEDKICADCDMFQPDPENREKGFCWRMFPRFEDAGDVTEGQNKIVNAGQTACAHFKPKIVFFDKSKPA